ncbi:ubiquitin-like-specific protease ESD4 [Diospyros lotus]|uniref:ubiquitin-like-specific protease ESD4 n=1 Tax=Diospyros lotus TaxID=55363 RepID=UPI0022571676|nr:ubiquitin-like-specific protease ESD4 [Diospyros lotus]XP_052189328.1 ubiquitin-like-specific protease ESD4 [Diospyros lotus]XP_052189329.1 ubiquitin-like-specific protease ESD4 [Diospyros lotus]
MGALTSNRKRCDDDFTSLNFKTPSFYSLNLDDRIDTHISKKPKTSMSMHPSSGHPVSSASSRIYRYPEPVNQIRREVHAPCRLRKFGFWASSNREPRSSGTKEGLAEAMGNALSSHYDWAKTRAIETLRFLTKDKEVIDVDSETENDTVLEDSSIEEVEVLEDAREGRSVGSDSRDVNLKVDDAGKRLDILSLNQDSDVMGLLIHKKLLESAERRNPKLSSLSFQIELNEKRLASFQSLRPAKKPEEKDVHQDLLREPFTPLTEEEEAEVSRALSNSHRRRVLARHDNSNIEITGAVLQCLRPGAWLDDEVINLYLELLKEREKREPKKFLKCHFFNTFFYKKLIGGSNGYDFKSVRRWTTQKKLGYCLLECDKIFVPIHKEVHWCLAVINKKDKKLQYLDSLGGIDSRVLKVLARYFVDEVKDKSGKDIDISSWQEEYVEDLPQQENGWDCGVFMIKYVDFYSRGLGLCFNQEHMPYFRQRTAKEILRLKAE